MFRNFCFSLVHLFFFLWEDLSEEPTRVEGKSFSHTHKAYPGRVSDMYRKESQGVRHS